MILQLGCICLNSNGKQVKPELNRSRRCFARLKFASSLLEETCYLLEETCITIQASLSDSSFSPTVSSSARAAQTNESSCNVMLLISTMNCMEKENNIWL